MHTGLFLTSEIYSELEVHFLLKLSATAELTTLCDLPESSERNQIKWTTTDTDLVSKESQKVTESLFQSCCDWFYRV